MEKKAVLGTMLTLLLMSILTLAFNIQPVKATGTIYVKADGSVDPPTAPIQRDGDIYTFTNDIYDSIVIERNNMIIDGAGHTLQGVGSGVGLDLSGRDNVTIVNIEIKAFDNGIWLVGSSNNNISGNNLTAINYMGIVLYYSSNNNSISRNIVTNNGAGILLYNSSLNTIFANNIIGNSYGIKFHSFSSFNNIFGNNMTNNGCGLFVQEVSNNNILYHNNFINNPQQVDVYRTINVWNDGYPSGGNYWSNHIGVDLYRGRYQNETGSDGIADTSYMVDASNVDRYPLVSPYVPFIGDLNDDRQVDIRDISIAAFAFGSYPDHPRWISQADINQDSKVDIRDLALIARNFGKTYP